MTPQELNTTIKRYWDTISNPGQSQADFLAALAELKAAYARYESIPTAVHPLGVFTVRSGGLIVVDAYCPADRALPITAAENGTWVAILGVETGVHVALFAYHESDMPAQTHSPSALITQTTWRQVGMVPIDTATCAIADGDTYTPLEAEGTGHQIAGAGSYLCFSNSANTDGLFPVFTHAQNGIVRAVYAQFADIPAKT